MIQKPRLTLAVMGILVLLFFAARFTSLDAFPPFIDETIHLQYAELILDNRSPLEGINLGRQFTLYYYVLFDTPAADPIWVGRAATVIASVITFVLWLAVAKLSANLSGMIAVGLLLIISPYHFFFERLALSDSISTVAVTAAIYFAFRLKYRVNKWDAMIVGVLLFAAVGAKTGTLPYLGIPIAAGAALRPHGRRIMENVRWVVLALGMGLGLLLIMIIAVRLRGLDFIGNSLSLAASNRAALNLSDMFSPSRLLTNISYTLDLWFGYFQLPGIVFALIGIAWILAARKGYFLLLFAPVLALWLGIPQENRYWIVPTALMLVCGGLGIVAAFKWARPYWRGFLAIFLGFVFLGAFINFTVSRAGAPFQPLVLPRTARDVGQYASADGSGFGFNEVFDRLDREGHFDRIIGVLSNCQGLRFVGMTRGYTVECPQVRPNGQDIQTLEDLFAQLDGSNTVIILEDTPYAPPIAPGREIEVIAHSSGRPTLTLYDLATRN